MGLTLYGCLSFNQAMYPIPTPSYQDSTDIIKLPSSNGNRISARFFPHPNASWVILYSHGNAEDLGSLKNRAFQYNQIGASLLAYDYQGYGTSEGSPNEKNTYADIQAAYNYLTNKLKIPPRNIIAHGFSLGGGVALELASHNKLGGIILESSFVSAFRVVTRYPISPFDKYKNLKKIRTLRCPVLIIHGREDQIVPFWHGQALYKAANKPKDYYWIPRANHNTTSYVGGRKYWDKIKNFLSTSSEQGI